MSKERTHEHLKRETQEKRVQKEQVANSVVRLQHKVRNAKTENIYTTECVSDVKQVYVRSYTVIVTDDVCL